MRSQTERVIRVGAGVSDTFAEGNYAVDAGFFKQAGLNVELSTFPNGTASVTAVVAGALDVAISNTITIATAVTHGFPLVFIAGGALYLSDAATTVLCVARDSPLREARDLEGKTVAVSALRDMNALGAKAWLAQNGADIGKVAFIELAFPEMGPALKRGTVAAATMNEPFLTAERSDVRTFGKMFDVIGKRFMNGVWFSTPAWTRANPHQARRFAGAIYATARWANANHDASATILASHSKIDPAIVRSMTRVTYADGLDPRLIQLSLDLGIKYKVIDSVNATELVARF